MSKKIRIFLGSSQELKVSRDEFEKFIRRKNDSWVNRDISLQLIIWEDFVDAVSKTRKQDDYNAAIRESDILLILVFSKVGMYTKEEFETGYDQFLKTGSPLIYTYFQFPRIDEGDRTREEVISLYDFEDRLKQLNHFKTTFKSVEDLQLKFSEQLDKLYPYTPPPPAQSPGTSGFPHLLTNIPKHDDEFIGREEDLKNLEKELEASSKIVLMNGLGGIGKTTLAKKFVQDNLNNYDHVAWIEVKTQDTGHEQNMSITEAFAYNEVLTKSLNLEFTNESNDVRFQLIIQALSNLPGKNLLVIDNARDDLNNIKDILPRPPQWNILITSRNNFSGFKIIEIETLPKGKAKELFKAYYKNPADEKDVEDLLTEIGYHTLTIELLAKTLAYPGQKLPVKEVFQKIRSRQLSSPELQRKIELNHSKAETEIYLHLLQTFSLLPLTEQEQWLMKQFCFLLPVSYTIDELENFLNIKNEEKEKELHETLNALSKKGWLQLNERSYNIHRIVQQMTDYQLQPSLKDVEQLVEKFKNLLLTDVYTNITKLFFLIPYAEFILSKLREEEIELPVIGGFQINLAEVIRKLGNYEKARQMLEACLKNHIKTLGDDHPDVARGQSNLAMLYKDFGEFEKAKELLELALKKYIKNFGEDHPAVVIVRSNLAIIYRSLKDYEKAKELLELTLGNAIKNLGEGHPVVALRQSNLALVYKDLKEYKKAKELLEHALENDIKNLGEDHPSVSVDQSNLALIYQDIGEYEKAKELLELALKNNIKNFDEDHPEVVIVQSNLASLYQQLGEYEKTETLLNKAYSSRIRTLGKDHPKTKIIEEKLKYLKKHFKK
ncbi:MAG: tetratricopeptide repeat protein [Chitinophagaceae bacterium]|nr:tetratricopeptide repeat protein [Chitinophagaceae bacterium]